MNDIKCYTYWLCSLPGIGNRTIEKLLRKYQTPQEIFKAAEKDLEQVLTKSQMESFRESRKKDSEKEIRKAYEALKHREIGFLTREDVNYPKRLQNIPDAPYGLFFKGSLPKEEQITVAMIGARDCSEYGKYVAAELGRYLGSHGVQVISGMARGIDGISQEAAIDAGGTSFGVLGCGVDICYPAQNQKLYDRLLKQGGILSAYPPGSLPGPRNFPPRNRIVSGLADAVIVIEARRKSGTLITVDMALEQGRDVYVVPGRVTDRLSDGCNSLLKQGAEVFLSPEEFLRELQENQVRKQPQTRAGNLALTEKVVKKEEGREYGEQSKLKKEKDGGLEPELKKVYNALDFYPQSMEEIASRLPEACDIRILSTSLMLLCLKDAAVQVTPGYFCLKS
ncbi:MAG: DNA-processing protein DprA [Lachnoclostridium sp.]|nr:DNA-processing protein DprA [Lachnospira sp.]MCM1246873.1 DNA-processing protein DprA [Lachnoclostridium sp.]